MTREQTYAGMSYEQASREGLRLVQEAAETGAWVRIIDKLEVLRRIMDCHLLSAEPPPKTFVSVNFPPWRSRPDQ